MSLDFLRAELESWDAALKSYDAGDFERALALFDVIYLRFLTLCRPALTGFPSSASQNLQRYSLISLSSMYAWANMTRLWRILPKR